MQPYAHAPRMGAGTAGKHGLLRLGFERDGERTIMLGWERHAPLIVQQAKSHVIYCFVQLAFNAGYFSGFDH